MKPRQKAHISIYGAVSTVPTLAQKTCGPDHDPDFWSLYESWATALGLGGET